MCNAKNFNSIKWANTIETTKANYANRAGRLKQESAFANFILIYYSTFLIVFSITAIIFPELFYYSVVTYWNIVLSIVLLVFSLVNDKANFIIKINTSLEIVQSLSKMRQQAKGGVDITNEYHSLMQTAGHVDPIDFHRTIQQLSQKLTLDLETSNKEEYTKLKNKLKRFKSDIPFCFITIINIGSIIWNIILFILPIVGLVISIVLAVI